jgi:hypothetical protein
MLREFGDGEVVVQIDDIQTVERCKISGGNPSDEVIVITFRNQTEVRIYRSTKPKAFEAVVQWMKG